MSFEATGFPDLFTYTPKIFKDSRGYFFESYNQEVFKSNNLPYLWVQDNQSSSQYGVVRGLHFQNPPFAQSKLIRVLKGSILDVVVDIRKNSPTYSKVFSIEISCDNKIQLLIPKGFAHGFSVLSEEAIVLYKCDALYNKGAEGSLYFDDPALNIDWKVPVDKRIVSDKDAQAQSFTDFNSQFNF